MAPQHLFEQDTAPLLPTGAVLVTKQWYDNTSDNPNNLIPGSGWDGANERPMRCLTLGSRLATLTEELYQELAV